MLVAEFSGSSHWTTAFFCAGQDGAFLVAESGKKRSAIYQSDLSLQTELWNMEQSILD